MANSDTVKLHITIDIQAEDPSADTGVTLDEWNAMTEAERSDLVDQVRDSMMEADNGGVSVVTPGARWME